MSDAGGACGHTELFLRLVEELEPGVLENALTHSSWVKRRVLSYERLEFLGDSVLGLAIASELFRRFPQQDEGDLARWKAFVVSRGSCHAVACGLGLDEVVRASAPGTEEEREELAASPSALGNVLEALAGACYLSFGFDRTRAALVAAFSDQISYAVSGYVDFKSTLQEHLAARNESAPRYVLVAEEGPAHERVFQSEVVVDAETRGVGRGTSIKKSEQRAAAAALVALGVLSADEVGEDPLHDDAACPVAGDRD